MHMSTPLDFMYAPTECEGDMLEMGLEPTGADLVPDRDNFEVAGARVVPSPVRGQWRAGIRAEWSAKGRRGA